MGGASKAADSMTSTEEEGGGSMRGMRTRYRGLLRTARDIAQGLEYLHCRGITHGVRAFVCVCVRVCVCVWM